MEAQLDWVQRSTWFLALGSSFVGIALLSLWTLLRNKEQKALWPAMIGLALGAVFSYVAFNKFYLTGWLDQSFFPVGGGSVLLGGVLLGGSLTMAWSNRSVKAHWTKNLMWAASGLSIVLVGYFYLYNTMLSFF